MTLTLKHKTLFLSFFNSQGYVLDFNNDTFEKFCIRTIDLSPQKIYGLSKGKSLEYYVDDEPDENKIKKLFKALLEHYESSKQYEREKESNNQSEKSHYELYLKVKQYEYVLDDVIMVPINTFSSVVNSEYINTQIELMIKNQKVNPTEAIGKAKELLESVCKTILVKLKIDFDDSLELQALVKKTCKTLKLTPDDINDSLPLSQNLKQILGGLATITHGLASLRNTYGSGHGKNAYYKGLEERHAKLAVGSASVLINFLWDCYLNQLKND